MTKEELNEYKARAQLAKNLGDSMLISPDDVLRLVEDLDEAYDENERLTAEAEAANKESDRANEQANFFSAESKKRYEERWFMEMELRKSEKERDELKSVVERLKTVAEKWIEEAPPVGKPYNNYHTTRIFCADEILKTAEAALAAKAEGEQK